MAVTDTDVVSCLKECNWKVNLQIRKVVFGNFFSVRRAFSFFWLSFVQFSHSVMSNSLESRELQHTRLPWLSSLTIFLSLLKLMSIESLMPSNHLILCHPLLLLPSIFPSIKIFSNESVLHIKWPKYWSFSFSISPSSEYYGLTSFRIDWFDLLAVQELSRVISSTTV